MCFVNNFDGFVVVGDNFICVYFIEVLFHHFVVEEEEKKRKKVSFKIWCCSFCSCFVVVIADIVSAVVFCCRLYCLKWKRGCEEEVCLPTIDVDIFVVFVVVVVFISAELLFLLLSLLKRSTSGGARRSLGIICS